MPQAAPPLCSACWSSCAFLVWTEARSGVTPLGDLVFGRDRSALLDAPADNIFVLKVSYWLGL